MATSEHMRAIPHQQTVAGGILIMVCHRWTTFQKSFCDLEWKEGKGFNPWQERIANGTKIGVP